MQARLTASMQDSAKTGTPDDAEAGEQLKHTS